MEFITQLVNQVNSLLWDELLIFLLCGTGIYYTLRLGFIQIRHFKSGFKALFSGISLSGAKADKQGMSSFQAVATAIAGQVGTGNLAGPATAIIAGGPGAIFWIRRSLGWRQFMLKRCWLRNSDRKIKMGRLSADRRTTSKRG